MDERPRDETIEPSEGDEGLVREFVAFLLHRKKWWIIPILLALVFIAALVMLSGSTEAPFIYTPIE